jgi:hypothetical protein
MVHISHKIISARIVALSIVFHVLTITAPLVKMIFSFKIRHVLIVVQMVIFLIIGQGSVLNVINLVLIVLIQHLLIVISVIALVILRLVKHALIHVKMGLLK